MALTPQEIETVKRLKKEGKTSTEIAGFLGGTRIGRGGSVSVAKEQEKKENPDKGTGFVGRALADIPSDLAEGFMGIGEQSNKAGEKIVETAIDPNLPIDAKGRKILAESFRGGARMFGEGVMSLFKSVIPQKEEEQIGESVQKFAEDLGQNPDIQNIVAQYEALDPETKSEVNNALGFAEGLAEIGTGGLASRLAKPVFRSAMEAALTATKTTKRVAGETVETVAKGAGAVAKDAVENAPPILKAGAQKASEFGDNIQRLGERGKEAVDMAAQRAERIANATPAEQQAIKNNVSEEFIDGVKEADKPLLKSYKEVLDVIEESPKGFGQKKNPAIVSGESAVKQFELIEKKRNEVGKAIGDKVKELSKEQKVDMTPNIQKMNDVLSQNGIKVVDEGKLDFSGTEYTKAERTRIQELYDLATEGGGDLTPNQIYRKDRLFSKLQREARLEGISDIIVSTTKETGEEGTTSLFRVFRDIYSNQLDELAPEIKDLNREYRKYSMMVDDIEDSIFRTPNFNITKSTDASEFAKVNLRRIFGEANSSPVYEAIADQMDTVARELGYEGASPKQIAAFTLAIRKIYPEAIPEAGLSGILRSSILDTIGSAFTAGKANTKDQQKALRALIEASLEAGKDI